MTELPSAHRRTVLSSAEMQAESWKQMQDIFPRLKEFNGPAQPGTVRKRVPR